MKKTFAKALFVLAVSCFIYAIAPMSGSDLFGIDLDITVEAATVVNSGSCGENLTWELDDEGTLTMSDLYHPVSSGDPYLIISVGGGCLGPPVVNGSRTDDTVFHLTHDSGRHLKVAVITVFGAGVKSADSFETGV